MSLSGVERSMANKRQRARKRSSGFRAIPFNKSLTIGTLATGAVISVGLMDSDFTDDQFVISAEIFAMIRNLTVGEGPLIWGVSHGDLTDAEIAEQLVAGAPNRDNIIEMEQARRPVRKMGIWSSVVADDVMNDGQSFRRKIGFRVGDGNNLDMWLQSKASQANLTGGASLQLMGTLFVRKI